jgi:hypothetical protein
MKKWTVYLYVFCFFSSCGKSDDQKIQDAILSASYYLSSGSCQSAIDVLENLGRQNTNARYLKTLASAYSCRAGFSTLTYFSNDLSKTATPSPLGGTTLYSTSTVSVSTPFANDQNYLDLTTAMNILLYAGGISSGTEPTASERANYFSSDDQAEINSQLMFIQLVLLGKFMGAYGAANSSGVKTSCFTSYSNAPTDVQTIITGGAGGACTTTSGGSTQLSSSTAVISAAVRKTRLCQGVVIFNGLLESMPLVLASISGDSLGSLSGITDVIDDLKDDLTTAYPGIGTVLTTLNQTNCEDNSAVPVADIETYYAALFETIFQ